MNLEKKRILFYLKGYGNPSPGAESAGFNILQSLMRQSDLEFIIVSDNRAKPFGNERLFKHFSLPIKIPIIDFIVNNFFAARLLRKLNVDYSPDIVHIQGYAGYYVEPPRNVRSILTFHDDPEMRIYDSHRKDPLKFLEYLFFEFAFFRKANIIPKFQFFHAMSSRIQKNLRRFRVRKEKIFLIPNGVNQPIIPKNSDNRLDPTSSLKNAPKLMPKHYIKLLFMVGMIDFNKGVFDVCQSLKYLPSNYHLLLAGKPTPLIGMPFLINMVKMDPKRIHYLGFFNKQELDQLYKAIEVYISASYFEGCQLAPLEAISMEKKVVTSTAGAILDFFPKEYPYLLRNHNPQEIAMVIQKACESAINLDLTRIKKPEPWEKIGQYLNNMYNTVKKVDVPISPPNIFLRFKLIIAQMLDKLHIFDLYYYILHATYKNNYIQAVYYHDTPTKDMENFELQLKFYKKYYSPVSLSDLNRFFKEKKWFKEKPGLIITFDDGLYSNFLNAKPLLEKYGFIGWFFIPASFIEQPLHDQEKFASDHLILYHKEKRENAQKIAISWDDLRILHQKHVVCSHTLSHVRLSNKLSPHILKQEIIHSKKQIEDQLKSPCEVFSWVGGEFYAYSKKAAFFIRKAGYRFVFQTNSAIIRPNSNTLELQRVHCESNFPMYLVRFQLSGIMDLFYLFKRIILKVRLS